MLPTGAQPVVRAAVEGPRERERIRTLVVSDHDDLAALLAERIVGTIRRGVAANGRCVLGLATGSTPLGIYRELIRRHRAGEVDFAAVTTFNLDEYYPMVPDSPHSYRRYMWENFFAHVNIKPESVHIPDGSTPRERLAEHCAAYEQAIVQAGGIDVQILGIGKSGHIGFNEPGSPPDSRTRLVTLDTVTRRDAAADFFGEDNVPREAITMGVATILQAREIALIATGEHKADVVRRAVEGEPSPDVAATFLQGHPHAAAYLDLAAAGRRRELDGRDPAQAVGERKRDRRRLHDERQHRGVRSRRAAAAGLRGARRRSARGRPRGGPAGTRRRRGEFRAQRAGGHRPAGRSRLEADDPRGGGNLGARVRGAAARRRPVPQFALLPHGRSPQAPDRGRGRRAGARAPRGSAPRPRVRRGRLVRSARHAPDVQGGGGARPGGLHRDPASGLAVPRRVAGVAHHAGRRAGAAVAGRAAGQDLRHLQAPIAKGHGPLPRGARRPGILAAGRGPQHRDSGAGGPAGAARVLRDGGVRGGP